MSLVYSFDVDEAIKYGLDEAIMLQNLKFWIAKNKANEKHMHDKHTWTYNSIVSFKRLFPFWTENQIRRVLKNLIDQKIIITGNYNQVRYDRTLWYAFENEEIFIKDNNSICEKIEMENGNSTNGIIKNLEPIPDNKPYDKHTDNKRVDKAPENTGAKPSTNNHPVNLTKINKRILAITKTSFSAVEFFNRLPDETDEFCPTKTYERIQEFLYSLHECKIKSNYLFDDKWLERNHIDFKVLREKAVGANGQSRLPYDDIQEMFEKSVKNYALMRKEGYWPADKEKLTLNFANFLYNFKQKTSWFLYCLFNDPKEMQETCAEKVIESLPEDVQETIIDFGGGEVIGQDTWPKFSYYPKAKELYLWYSARVKKLCKYHTLRGMDGFRSYLGCFSDLIAMIYEFAQTWKGKWSVNNFGMNCKTWDLFLSWLEKEHGYVIDVGEKELNNAEERYDDKYPAKKRELVKN
jgi:hypothetical protein